ncbi:hypothetical protein MMPV_007808 [Pyropia vietnamensis]
MAPPPTDGARCAVATCRDWQLLPVRCSACDLLHCTAHGAPHAHACTAAAAAAVAYDAIAYPACGVALLPPSARTDDRGGGWGGGADAVVAAHLDAGCPQGRRAAAAAVAAVGSAERHGGGGSRSGGGSGRGGGGGLPPPSTPYTRCGLRGCSVRSPVVVACGGCGGDFCITHRLEADHGCEGRRRPPVAPATATATAASRRALAVAAARTVRPHRQATAAPAVTSTATPAAAAPSTAGAASGAAKWRRRGPPRPSAVAVGGASLPPPRNTPATAVKLASTPGDTLTVVVYLPLGTGEAPLHAALPLRGTVGVALDGLEGALPRLAAARSAAGVRRWGVWAVGPGGGVQRLPHMGVAAALVAARVLVPGVALVVDAPDGAAGGEAAEAAPLPDAWAPLLPLLVAATTAGAAAPAGGAGGGAGGRPLGRPKKGFGIGGKASSSSTCRVS